MAGRMRIGPSENKATADTAPTLWLPPQRSGRDEPRAAGGEKMTTGSRGDRRMLWIDGVGAYLVCTGKRVLIGQAVPDAGVDIAIQGDLSRRHAWICRDGEGYLIEALQTTRVAGRPVEGATSLADGDLIELGGTVRMRFRKPHALSGSACLEMVSRHRTQPAAEGIVLMAESCVLGPQPSSHITCRAWSQELVLYRRDEKLFCRSRKSFDINGQPCAGSGQVAGDSRIVGEDFSLSVEHLT